MKPAPTPPGRRRGLPSPAAGVPVPADKRFRRSDLRPWRRRNWRRVLVRAAWFGSAGIVVLVSAAWIGSVLLDASVLRVGRLDVSGNSLVPTADIEARLDGLRGQSVLRADLEQYRVRVLENPWVAAAELWRVLPSTIRVRVVERRPLAIARLSGQLYLVDGGGVIDRFGPQYRQFDLPIVDGLITDASAGPVVDPARIALVERLFRQLSPRADLLRRLSQVDVSDAQNAVVLMEGEPAKLRLGDGHFRERIELWETYAGPTREQQAVNDYWELRCDCGRIWAR